MSRSIYSRYHRQPSDLRLVASRTVRRMEVRCFFCRNSFCNRRTFAEASSEFLRPRARRTRRLAEAQGRIGIACGGARLLKLLRMPARRAPVLRLIRSIPMADAPKTIHIAVDDWAMRKGYRYGKIVVDLDRHRVIDLLPDCTATTLAGWLERKPDIRVVARDGATNYVRGVSLSALRALQVADRWHLLANICQAVERRLHSSHARLKHLPPVTGSMNRLPRRDHAFPRSMPELDAGAESRTRWRAIYDEVRHRHAGGETLLGIARVMGLSRATVRDYATADPFPLGPPHGAGPSLLDPHVSYLVWRIGDGCENVITLWREIRQHGYPGTS